jgi:hypothetical protein
MPGGSRGPRLLVRLTGALLAASAAASFAGPMPAVAVDGGLPMSASARYELIPAERRVHVTVDASVTNLTPDNATQRFYYTGVSIPAPPGAANPTASSGGGAIGASIAESTDEYTLVEVTFGLSVFYRQSYSFRLSFDIVDAGGDAARDVRIGAAFASFPVWAFGDPGTPAEVEVLIPPGFNTTLLAGEMTETQEGTSTLLSAGSAEDAGSFFAYITAEQPDALATELLDVTLGDEVAEIELSAWPDDPEWLNLVRPLLVDGLPLMSEEIGLPYPIPFKLRVTEQAFGELGNYSGLFDPQTDAIAIRYDADAFVTLHESAHIWFNGDLFEDRWIGEAFASYYAEVVGERLGVELDPFLLTDELRADAFPLNEWDDPGREDLGREDYAYSATHELGRQIATVAGEDGLRAVWLAADMTAFSYQAVGAEMPEVGEPTVSAGWQRLLDLLEERTGEDFDPLWIEFVVSDSEVALLTERERARAAYAELVADADGWALPRPLRLVMGAWQFDLAGERMRDVREIFDVRDEIAGRAAELDLEVPPDLRSAFEVDGVDAAADRAADEIEALDAIEDVGARLEPELVPLEWVGLLGEAPPEAALTGARDAYESGEAAEAVEHAGDADAARDAADDRGRQRVILAGAGLLALDGAAMGGLFVRRRRRQPAA